MRGRGLGEKRRKGGFRLVVDVGFSSWGHIRGVSRTLEGSVELSGTRKGLTLPRKGEDSERSSMYLWGATQFSTQRSWGATDIS